jgi:hypothetical protein
MRLTLPIHPPSISPWREALFFTGLTIAVTWLFWFPGVFLPMGSTVGDFLLAIGSFAPLAVAVFLQVWLQKWTLTPMRWIQTVTAQRIVLAALVPIALFAPVILLRIFQDTLDLGNLFSDACARWLTLVGLLILATAEEIGWRAYLLPRLKAVPLYVTNLCVGFAWFIWQIPLVLAGRYNTSENFGGFVLAMFLYALLVTPFLNRIALRAEYNPLLSGITRALLTFVVAIYFLQGRGDPLSDTFGNLTIGWLVLLNLILFSQLWLGKKPPAEISELERVMPLEIGN